MKQYPAMKQHPGRDPFVPPMQVVTTPEIPGVKVILTVGIVVADGVGNTLTEATAEATEALGRAAKALGRRSSGVVGVVVVDVTRPASSKPVVTLMGTAVVTVAR